YRKLTWMMVDAGAVCVGESTVYRVLSEADLLSRWKRSAPSDGEYRFRPNGPNQQWHTDGMYVWVAARYYFLVSFVDAYSRYVVHRRVSCLAPPPISAVELGRLQVRKTGCGCWSAYSRTASASDRCASQLPRAQARTAGVRPSNPSISCLTPSPNVSDGA